MTYDRPVLKGAYKWQNLVVILSPVKGFYYRLEGIETFYANVLEAGYDAEDINVFSDKKIISNLQQYARTALDDLRLHGIISTVPGEVLAPKFDLKEVGNEYEDDLSLALAEAFDCVHAMLLSLGFLEAVYDDAREDVDGQNLYTQTDVKIQEREIEERFLFIDATASMTLEKLEKLGALIPA